MKNSVLVLFIATLWVGELSFADDGYNEGPEQINSEYDATWAAVHDKACDHWLMTSGAVNPIGTNDYLGYAFPSGFVFSHEGIAQITHVTTANSDPQKDLIRWLLTTQVTASTNQVLIDQILNSNLESKLRLLHARAAAAAWAHTRGAEIIEDPERYGHVAVRDLRQSLREVAHFDEEVLIPSLRGYQPEHFAKYLNEMYVIASDLFLADDPWNALDIVQLIENAGQRLNLAQLNLSIAPALSLRLEIASQQVIRYGADILGFDLALQSLANTPHVAPAEVAHPYALMLNHLARLYWPGTYGARDVGSIAPERKELGQKLAQLIVSRLPRDFSTLASPEVVASVPFLWPSIIEQMQSAASGVYFAERNQLPGLLNKEGLALIRLYTLLTPSEFAPAATPQPAAPRRQLN